MIEVVFWCATALVIYIYIGYPLLARLLARMLGKAVAKADYLPHVTIIIAAYNEERHIAATLNNKLGLNYPADKLDIIVVSDGSADQTDSLVEEFVRSYPQIRLMRQIPRKGKTGALNMAVPAATGEIIVFSDANSIYKDDALRILLRNFSDPSVGYVTGKMVYADADGTIIGDGCSAFMRYENRLRQYETDMGSVVGVNGGIDAVRKNLYVSMRPDQLPDFVLPLCVVDQGYRVVYEPAAILVEDSLKGSQDEYNMRVRVSLRAYWAMYDMRKLFNPLRTGIYSLQLASHKALRYLAFVPLILALASNIYLVVRGQEPIYIFALAAQCFLYGMAVFVKISNASVIKSSIGTFAYYFVLLNIASAHAFIKFVQGKKQVVWQPRTG